MAQTPGTVTGAIALISIGGRTVGLAKTIRAQEQYSRGDVRGLGTVFASEKPVLSHQGTLSCDFFLVDFKTDGVKEAINRVSNTIYSQALTGGTSFEDNLVLNTIGFDFTVYKKITDIMDPVTKIITPKVEPLAVIRQCFIETDSFDISEGSVSGKSQSFVFLQPITYTS